MPSLYLSGRPEADTLLSNDPLALLIGMVLDQQIPLEWAFAGPAELKLRLGGHLDVRALAAMDPDELAAAFSERPALHRYPTSMARRVQELCLLVVDKYGGKPEKVWTGATSGKDLVARLHELPGFGAQKARIFGALLAKQLGVRPEGWEAATSPFGDPGTFRSVADIVSADTLARVRAYKQDMKAAARAAAEKAPAKKAPAKKTAAEKAPAKKAGGGR